MNGKFVSISLSSLLEEKFANILLNSYLENKAKIEKILDNPYEMRRHIEKTILELETKKQEYKELHTKKGYTIVSLTFDAIIKRYQKFQSDNEKYKKILKKQLEYYTNEAAKEQEKVNMTTDDIQAIITIGELKRENIENYIDDIFYNKNFSEETKQKIKEFIIELFDKGKIHDMSQNKISPPTIFELHHIDPGLYTTQEFEQILQDEFRQAPRLMFYLETCRELFPEQFPPELSAVDIFKKFNKGNHSLSEKEKALLEKFDEVYFAVYGDKKQSIEDNVLNGTMPVSFTTLTSEDKVK